MFIPVTAALLAIASTSALGAGPAQASGSPALRFEGAASASATVKVRIIGASASIGADLGPPAPRMVARRTTVTAADGRGVPALVYDFE